jgi:hypothetical protein
LRYALTLEAGSPGAPVVDDVVITTQRRGFPQNVTVRFGASGVPWFNVSGTFDTAVNISVPPAFLDSIIASTLAQFPSATSVDIPLVVTTSHYGQVEFREWRATQVLKNPLSVAFFPAGTALAFGENNSTKLGAYYTVIPADTKVNHTWSLDGAALPANRDQLEYNFTADFFTAGNHTVFVEVENGDFRFNHTWNIEVWQVDRAPRVSLASPASPFSLSHAATANFTAAATDPDNDVLAYRWNLDGSPLSFATSSVTLSGLQVGLHTLTVFVTDGFLESAATWLITSTNQLPQFLDRSPLSDFNMSHTATQQVAVSVIDGDGELLTFEWRMDGQIMSAFTSAQATAGPLPVGGHILEVTVRDAYGFVSSTWVILSTNAVPALASVSPAGDSTVSHSSTLEFVVSYTDADGDNLSLTWFVDGAPSAVATARFTLGPVGLGPRTVRVAVTDGYSNLSRLWLVTGLNAAPVLMNALPALNVTMSVADAQTFEVQAADADGDLVSYAWQLGVVPLNVNASSVVVGPLAAGNHELSLTVSDAWASALIVFRITVVNYAPVIVAANPSDDFIVSHIAVVLANVTVQDHEGDALSYAWSIDGRVLAGGGASTSFGPLAEGEHVLRLVVRDAASPVERTWNITATNAPPQFLDVAPSSENATVNALESLTFSVRAVDADGEAVLLSWTVDNDARANGTNSLVLSWPAGGKHTVAVDATSAGHIVTRRWNLTVVQVNAPPAIQGAAPNGSEVSVRIGEEAVFAVEVQDDGTLPITVTWLVDGFERGTGSGFVYRPQGADAGTHEIMVRISDGQYTAEHSWTVRAFESSEVTQTGGLGDVGLLALGLAIGAGAMAGMFLMRRRKAPPSA